MTTRSESGTRPCISACRSTGQIRSSAAATTVHGTVTSERPGRSCDAGQLKLELSHQVR